MTEQFLTFQSFTDLDLAKEIAGRLMQENISVKIEDTSPPIAPVIMGTSLDADIRIKIPKPDFQKAHAVLEQYYEKQIDLIEKDYYLFEFTNEELLEIIKKPDEWGYLDYRLGQKILKERGEEIQREKIETMKSERIKEISKSEEIGTSWIFLGYFLAIFFSPIGIFFGLTITTFKRTLPDGQRVYSYNEDARKHGKIILIISSILTPLLIYFEVLSGTPYLNF
jgi:hypothetical protein